MWDSIFAFLELVAHLLEPRWRFFLCIIGGLAVVIGIAWLDPTSDRLWIAICVLIVASLIGFVWELNKK